MRKDACRGGLKTEAEVLRTFKESVCSAGHSMIKHVNVTSKAETLLRGVSSVFVLLPCSCEGGSDLGTLVSDIDLRDQQKNMYVYVGGKNKGSLFDLVHQREETGLPTPNRNAVDELLLPGDSGRQTRRHHIR